MDYSVLVINMSFQENIWKLSDIDFYISDFAAVKKKVIPPDEFVCFDSRVLYQRFFYVVKGTIVFDDLVHKKLSFSAGDIVYLPSNVVYESYWEKGEEGEFLSLNFKVYDSEHKNINFSNDLGLCYKDYDGKLYKLFLEMYELWKQSSRGYKFECLARLHTLFNIVAQYSEKQYLKKKNSTIRKAVLYLEDNYLTDVTVEDLVKLSNIHECQFRRSFKKLKGMSPIKYRNMLRLNKALEILKSGEYSVIETAMIVGFDDAAYFSRIFKEQFGNSPSYYIPSERNTI